MVDRFVGDAGRDHLLQSLLRQKLVEHSPSLAAALADAIELVEVLAEAELISQNASDNDLYLILAGSARIEVNGRALAIRYHGDHVGEMALIDASARRSATVRAVDKLVVGKVTARAFMRIAEEHPRIWRPLALELAARLRDRQRFHSAPHHRPYVFIGSSSEAQPVAEAIRARLASNATIEVAIWSHRVFGASRLPIEDLEAQLSKADFAVLVGSPDDRVTSRGRATAAPRDNIVFELGLFMGALSRRRTFLVVPDGVNLKIPTDILGLTTLRYDPVLNHDQAVEPACSELQRLFLELGAR